MKPRLGALDDAVARRLRRLDEERVVQRIWAKDPTVWKPDPRTPEIADRLGWLTVADEMRQRVDQLVGFAQETRRRFDPPAVRSPGPVRDGRIEPRARSRVANVRAETGIPGAHRAGYHGARHDSGRRGERRAPDHAVSGLQQVRHHAGNLEPLQLLLGGDRW